MTREVHDIPPVPRQVRWRAVLWHWWPLAFVGFVLAVYGGLFTLMLYLAMGGKPADDHRLDRECVQTSGRVTKVHVRARPPRIDYDFEVLLKSGSRLRLSGSSFLPGGENLKPGDRIAIEYLRGEPQKNRARGGRIVILPPLLAVSFYGAFLPGLMCLGLWFAIVLRLRRLMVHGDVAVGEVVSFRLVHYILPLMYTVEYSFRDHHAQVHTARHWVRARSALGDRLRANPARVGVICDRSGRGTSRLVMASDFARVNSQTPVAQGTQRTA
ncbi:MAG: DUF3592 domain-containing protein [Planctomycetota bacterium]|jgi:hypothetical protein